MIAKGVTNQEPNEVSYLELDIQSEALKDLEDLGQLLNQTSLRADFTAWELEGLRAHNSFRQRHGSPPLRLQRGVILDDQVS